MGNYIKVWESVKYGKMRSHDHKYGQIKANMAQKKKVLAKAIFSILVYTVHERYAFLLFD